MKIITPRFVKFFIPSAFIMTMSMGLIYVVTQQNFRMSANDPQIQLAEDFADQLTAGRTVASVNPGPNIDMAKSLALFIFVYDDAGNIVISSGKLDGQNPALPDGVLDYTKKAGQDRITWEPQPGLRVALVIIRYEGANPGFVAVGRSLREVEQRVSRLGLEVLGAWLAGLAGLFILLVGSEIILSRYPSQ